MSNAGGALDGLFALEDEAAIAHKRVENALEGIRVLLDRATVERYGKKYQLSGLRAHRGVVHAYGRRIYLGKVGSRSFDLGDLRGCKIIAYLDDRNPRAEHPRRPAPNMTWHPSHHTPADVYVNYSSAPELGPPDAPYRTIQKALDVIKKGNSDE